MYADIGQCFSIGSGVAVSILDINGLGISIEQLDEAQVEVFSKASYEFSLLEYRDAQTYRSRQALFASQMLFVATLCFIKLSIVVLLWFITPAQEHKRLLLATAAFVTITGIISEITEAFQCHVPNTWMSLGGNTCFDLVSLFKRVKQCLKFTFYRSRFGDILAS